MSGLGSREFGQRIEPIRRELLAHCYRMLGSVDDAEDAVQETHLRAWRSFESFQGRSSFRAWVYKIATNACLSTLASRQRRVLPSGLGGPSDDPHAPPVGAGPDVPWIEPIPDAMVHPQDDPATIALARATLRLALIASLQYLPPRQRAVLSLVDRGASFPLWRETERVEPGFTAARRQERGDPLLRRMRDPPCSSRDPAIH